MYDGLPGTNLLVCQLHIGYIAIIFARRRGARFLFGCLAAE